MLHFQCKTEKKSWKAHFYSKGVHLGIILHCFHYHKYILSSVDLLLSLIFFTYIHNYIYQLLYYWIKINKHYVETIKILIFIVRKKERQLWYTYLIYYIVILLNFIEIRWKVTKKINILYNIWRDGRVV